MHGARGQLDHDDIDGQELAVTVQRLQWEEQHLHQVQGGEAGQVRLSKQLQLRAVCVLREEAELWPVELLWLKEWSYYSKREDWGEAIAICTRTLMRVQATITCTTSV